MEMRPVGVDRLAGDSRAEAVGEGVLDGGADADVRLDAGDEKALYLLFAEQEREVRGEKGGVAPFVNDRFARRTFESGEGERVELVRDAMGRHLLPLEIRQVRIVPFTRVDDEPVVLAGGFKQFPQWSEDLAHSRIVERAARIEKGVVDINEKQRQPVLKIR